MCIRDSLKELLSIASKFTVARILERDDFTKRYQSQTPIALHEFLYQMCIRDSNGDGDCHG